MAEEGQDRTEPATPRRREEARKQGQVAFSPDLAGSMVLLAGVVGLLVLGPEIEDTLLEFIRRRLSLPGPLDLGAGEAIELMNNLFVYYLKAVGLFLGVVVLAGAAASVLQVGFHITPERLEANFERLNPAAGLGRLFSLANLVKGLFALLKITLLGVLVYFVLRSRRGVIHSLPEGTVSLGAAQAWALTMRLALYIALVFIILGIADFIYQRLRFEKSLRMTKQEMKEELKREEGDPQIKARRRQMQREMARRRMLAEVPRATVVITNPTHFAVALQYDRGKMPAPRVVAKGRGLVAQKIAEVARAHNVPVLERPPLARTLFHGVEVDETIPPHLFQAVAEVLVFIYRLRGNNDPRIA